MLTSKLIIVELIIEIFIIFAICIASYLRIPSLPGTSPLLHPKWSFNVVLSPTLCSLKTDNRKCIFAQGSRHNSDVYPCIDQSPSCFLLKFSFLSLSSIVLYSVLCSVEFLWCWQPERERERRVVRRNGRWWRLPDNWPELRQNLLRLWVPQWGQAGPVPPSAVGEQ